MQVAGGWLVGEEVWLARSVQGCFYRLKHCFQHPRSVLTPTVVRHRRRVVRRMDGAGVSSGGIAAQRVVLDTVIRVWGTQFVALAEETVFLERIPSHSKCRCGLVSLWSLTLVYQQVVGVACNILYCCSVIITSYGRVVG